MVVHKSINVVLVAITFILAVVAAAKSQKMADDIRNIGSAIPDDIIDIGSVIPNDFKKIVHINNASIATAVLSAVLLLLAIGAFHFNTKTFGMVKGALCVVVLILGFVLIGFSASLMKKKYSNNEYMFVKVAIASGVFCLLSVGSCGLTVLKMLK